MDDFGFCVAAFLVVVFWFIGLIVGASSVEPTDLPNGCILYEDVIWCEVDE